MKQNEINKDMAGLVQAGFEKLMVNDCNEALRDLKAAEVIDKQNPEILYNIGICYSRLGLHKTAIEYFLKIINLQLTFVAVSTVRKLMAFSYIHLKDYANALSILEQVLKYSSDDTAALSMQGYCYEKQKKYFEALKVYKKIIENDNKHYNSYNSIAYIMALTNGNITEALKYATIAYNSDKNNPAYLDTLGYLYLKKGDTEKAKLYLNKALAIQPFSEEIKKHTAMLHNTENNY